MSAKDQKDGLGRLSRLGFKHLSECLFVVPKSYMDCTDPVLALSRKLFGFPTYYRMCVSEKVLLDEFKRPTTSWRDVARVQISLLDELGRKVKLFVFGAVFPWLKINAGDDLFFFGEIVEWYGSFQVSNPILITPDKRGQIHAIYKGKVGQVSGDAVGNGVKMALPLIDESACRLLAELGMMEDEFKKESGYDSPESLLTHIHNPSSVIEGMTAVDAAQKLTVKAIIRRAEANRVKIAIKQSSITISRSVVSSLIDGLPYKLTEDQLRSINEIVTDLRSPFPMKRLLSGDVGTGKSLVYMIPAVAAWQSGAKVGIIVPSQLLVSQVAREIRNFFPGTVVTEVIAGVKVFEGIAIGTTAILSAAIKSKTEFDFVVCDEQHKFSVSQKEALLKKQTNFLEATATAIPRTLAIVNYGGMSLSVLKNCPVKKEIVSRIVYSNEKDKLFDFVNKIISYGGQVAVITPLVEDQGDAEVKIRLQSVNEAYEEWCWIFPWARIGVLTGKMNPDDKKAVIEKMHQKELDILISTVVIETGVTLPSLRALVVVHPERFGASQLHQLRGRVARTGGRGYFMMFTPTDVEGDAALRLDLLLKYVNGFDIAEHDMALRGFGDIESGSASQTGSSRLLFWGANPTKEELEEESNRSKSLGNL